MKIVIHAPSYNPSSGGIIVLHKLCDILIELGYDAGFYLEEESVFYANSDYKHNSFRIGEVDPKKDIVVYPEIVWGNPLGFDKVVRYIMNVGHITLGRKDGWGKEDFWLYYSESFYDKLAPKNILSISDSKLNYFKDYNVPRVYKECFTYRKRKDSNEPINIVHSKDAIEIPFNISDEELIKIFNVCQRFYSYDTKTHLNVLASLCGCDSIVVPNGKDTREDVIGKSAAMHYGVAFGLEEIEQARETRPQLRTYLEAKQLNQVQDTKEMFNKIVEQLR